MDDPPPSTSRAGSASTSTPRWVKVFAVVAAIFLLVFAATHLMGNGLHHSHRADERTHGGHE